MRKLLLLLAVFAFSGVAAANDDDGFIWVDANTKIKLTPIKSAIGSAAGGASKAPEQPEKAKKPEKPKK